MRRCNDSGSDGVVQQAFGWLDHAAPQRFVAQVTIASLEGMDGAALTVRLRFDL